MSFWNVLKLINQHKGTLRTTEKEEKEEEGPAIEEEVRTEVNVSS